MGSLKVADIKPGMKLRAVHANTECYKVGDEFVAFLDRDGEVSIKCHDDTNGPEHQLIDHEVDGTTDFEAA